MRAVKAKAMRRVARQLTVGEDAASYLQHRKNFNIVLNPKCTRAVCQSIKRGDPLDLTGHQPVAQ